MRKCYKYLQIKSIPSGPFRSWELHTNKKKENDLQNLKRMILWALKKDKTKEKNSK